jgi:signal transduction histidine kinase
LRRGRLALLALASLIAPAVLVIEWTRGSRLDIPVLAGCAAVLFLLVVLRMLGLMRDVEGKLELLRIRDASLASTLGELERAQAERKQLLARTIRAAEDERVQVAAELHDGPIQHLAALGYSLESALTRMHEDGEADGERMVRQVQDGLSEEIRGLRRLMVTLRPPALDQAGLHVALRDFAEALAGQEGLEASVQVEEVPGLSPEAETALYRVAQEALRNTVRHARASRMAVALRGHGRAAQVTIEDDGTGFSPGAQFTRRGHFGIAGMRQRIEMVGGSLEITSAPGHGTTVQARVPRTGAAKTTSRRAPARRRRAPARAATGSSPSGSTR